MRFQGFHFDKIPLMDVLEHLVRPELLFEERRTLLKPGGALLISVPNVANIRVRLALLFGRFEYAARGILDRSHLRFYTRRSARRLIEQAGLEVTREESTAIPIELALSVSPAKRSARSANRILMFFTRLMPGLLGYQSVFVARTRDARATLGGK
ncbi:MAG: methyltransferase domain-containing protein [Bryobacteraceae bacterium]|jgi:2-polyprenyl-3-methyl-5-hydroxy-6-metoxy-1,4-benzoquinol methylase